MARALTRNGAPTPATFSRFLRSYRQALAVALRNARREYDELRGKVLGHSLGRYNLDRLRERMREESASTAAVVDVLRQWERVVDGCAWYAVPVLAFRRGRALPVAPGARRRFAQWADEANAYSAERMHALPCGADDALSETMQVRATAARFLNLYNVTGA